MVQGKELQIVVFTDAFFETNGVGSYYKTLLGWCAERTGIRVTIICPERDDLVRGDIPKHVIPIRGLIQFRNPFYKDLVFGYYSQTKLRRIVESIERPKIIHIATTGLLGVGGARVARRLRLPCVGCYHVNTLEFTELYGSTSFGRVGGWVGTKVAHFLEWQAYGHCRAMLAPSDSAAEAVRTFFSGDVEVIPNPIDVQRFRPATSRRGGFRRRYNGDGKVLAIVVGRIAREKNLDLVGEYLCGDDRINTVFVGDGPYRAALEKRWNATVTGFLQGEDLVAAYQQADVFVQLSVAETFGLTLVEAMASGLPAIALRSQGFVAKIAPGCGVEVIEEHELATLADRCVMLAERESRYQEAGRRARAFVQYLGVDGVMPRFEEFHRRIVNSVVPWHIPPTSGARSNEVSE